ncbi:putative CRISPR-associated protein [Hydrogenobaculum acidophilum]
MKEFHIISTGVSLITNAQKANIIDKNIKVSEESKWREMLDNPKIIEDLKSFIVQNPKLSCAELNTFLRVIEKKNYEDYKDIEVYLFGTNTSSNELSRRAIESYLKELGIKLYTPYETSGYFFEAQFDGEYAKDEFKKGIAELLDRLISIANKKIKEGYYVYFNPTGGFKAHVMTCALASSLLSCDIYYMNEEFSEVVFLPKLFYLPKGKEIKILDQLSTKIVSGKEAENIFNSSKDEIERLEIYGLVEIEEDEQKVYRLKITSRGKLILENLAYLKRGDQYEF